MRTDHEIVRQTNEIARAIAELVGFDTPKDFKFYLSSSSRAQTWWQAACEAQKIITSTDPNDALENIIND